VIGQVTGDFYAHGFSNPDFKPVLLGFMLDYDDLVEQWWNDEISWHQLTSEIENRYRVLTEEWKAAF
jgi:myo-inositol catabolism protein IolC